MPGRIVTEIERRYGPRGTEVLSRLRQVKPARGRIEATIGNVIGGSVMVGPVYWVIYLRGRSS